MNKIIALMPLKFNNTRLPGKNTKELGGRALYKWMLEKLESSNLIDHIYIYCNDPSLLDLTSFSDKVSFKKRPEYLDSDSTNFTEIFNAFIADVEADIYIYAHATAPFLSEESINTCIDLVKSGKHDSVFTAIQEKDYFWFNGGPLNYEIDSKTFPRSQDVTPLIRETSGVYVFRRSIFEKNKARVTLESKPVLVSRIESIDINTEYDFSLAEYFLINGQK